MSERCRFGPFQVDTRAGDLRRDGTVVPLQDLPFRLLTALLERPGEVVTRAELTARLWGAETFVDSTAGLNTAVAKLREALGDQAEQPIYIETIPKRGYRFIGNVEADLGIDPQGAGTRPHPSINKTIMWAAAALAVLGVGAAVLQIR